MNLKLKARSLQIKYKLTIEKYSHERAIRFSKNKDFYQLLLILKELSLFNDFVLIDTAL